MTEKKFYIGLDVHKRQTTYVVKDWDGKRVSEGSTATMFNDVHGVLEPYLAHCVIAMESSTSYYKLYQGFKKQGVDVRVANVIHLRRMIGKNDIVDAARLADMLRLNTLPESFIPDENIQHLRDLVGLYERFMRENTALKNQIHALIDMRGINIFGKTPFCKAWCFRLQEYIAQEEDIELRHLFDAQQDIRRRAEIIKAELIGYTKKNFATEHELLQSIPGFGELFASYIIAEVMPISRFANKKKLRRYAGVIPISDKSDTKTYRTYIPKCTSRATLRYALVEGAQCATKTKTRITQYFKKVKKGKHRNQALMCVARTICDIVYDVLSTKKPYNAEVA